PMVPLLIEALHDAANSGDDAQVARMLQGMAGRIYFDPDVRQFIAPVTPFLQSDNSDVAAAAEDLLALLPSTASYERRLKRKQRESAERIAAMRMQLQEKVLPEAEVDELTISQLRALKESSDEAIAYLVRCLNKVVVSHLALRALEELKPEARPAAVKELQSQINGPHQLNVLNALGALGPAAQSAVPDIAALLTSGEPAVLIAGLHALGEIGSDDVGVCQRVLDLSRHTESEVRGAALTALGGCQSPTGNARLLETVRTSDTAYRWIAVFAKTRPFPEAGYAVLEREIESTEGVQHMVRTAIENLGDAGIRLLPKLIASLPLHHQTITCDDFSQVAAIIASFGSAAAPALPHLERYLRGRHHYDAAQAIWRISPARAEALGLPDIYRRK
ncbi:MAG: hypothetical protein KDA57_21545, partial [Planctomycetales bacterium]|nr:hypothetical protein [Planctomycetales bacterium]